MKLREVVDLEAQLSSDEGQDEASLRARDRALYLGLSPPPAGVENLLSAWLAALRARFDAPRAGERLASAQRAMGYGLVLFGCASGWALAEALLHFEQGGAPVNVGHYLFVMVLGQLAALALLFVSLLLHRFAHALPLVGDVGRLLRFLTARLERRLTRAEAGSEPRLEQSRVLYHRVRTRLGLYAGLERYLFLTQTQLFAVAFNLGALASCVRLILFSDIAFAWSTSLASLDSSQVERLCALLSAPFSWLLPDARPSPALIERTQYFRFEGRFRGATTGTRGDALLASGWWRFVVACTVTYGLLPRLAALATFFVQFRRAEQRVPLDTPDVQRAIARLTSPAVSTRAIGPAEAGAEPARTVTSQPVAGSGSTVVLLYRDIPTHHALLARALRERLGLEVAQTHDLGGAQPDPALLGALRRGSASVTVVAEAWEAPDKSLRHLLATLREAIGARRVVRLVLIGEAHRDGFSAPEPEHVRLYSDRLTLLEDAYLSVETLPACGEPKAAEGSVQP